MPPMSAWWAILETKRTSFSPENTGATMATSGRCDPRPTNGSLEMNTSPGRMSLRECFSRITSTRPSIDAR